MSSVGHCVHVQVAARVRVRICLDTPHGDKQFIALHCETAQETQGDVHACVSTSATQLPPYVAGCDTERTLV